jgi:hypothetical protein
MALIMVTIKEEANTLKVSLTMFSSIGFGVMYQTVMAQQSMMNPTIARRYIISRQGAGNE